jgi:hypothetical protein
VDQSTPFAPKCKGEIGAYGWYNIADLPSTYQTANLEFENEHGARQRFYSVCSKAFPSVAESLLLDYLIAN